MIVLPITDSVLPKTDSVLPETDSVLPITDSEFTNNWFCVTADDIQCREGQVKCVEKDGTKEVCVVEEFICDEDEDCNDGRDEANCTSSSKFMAGYGCNSNGGRAMHICQFIEH